MKLEIGLVPSTCWFSNVRSAVTKADWEVLKKATSERAGRKCEICGGVGPKWPVECHEIWHYDDVKKVQTLKGLIALCPSCHQTKHIGLAQIRGKGTEATIHLAKVNGITLKEATAYIESAFVVWRERSKHQWKLDIDFLKGLGIKVAKNSDTVHGCEN